MPHLKRKKVIIVALCLLLENVLTWSKHTHASRVSLFLCEMGMLMCVETSVLIRILQANRDFKSWKILCEKQSIPLRLKINLTLVKNLFSNNIFSNNQHTRL